MTLRPRFRPLVPVLVRATTDPGDLELPSGLDLHDPAVVRGAGIDWLAKTWARPDVRDAIGLASPTLATRLDRLLEHPEAAAVKEPRRAIVSLASYLLRWQRRATPFGMFAGLATATTGASHAAIGRRHRAVARVDSEWLAALIDQLERHPRLLSRLVVLTDNTGILRNGRFITARRPAPGSGRTVPLREASVRYTRPVRAALSMARTPIRVDTVRARLVDRFPAASAEQIDAVLAGLVEQRFLITNLRPPMTVTDGLEHLLDALTAAGAHEIVDLRPLLHRLTAVRDLLHQHNTTDQPTNAASARARTVEHTTALIPDIRPALAVDTRLDAKIRIPQAVLDEAARAATVLLQTATKPFGSTGWLDYHSRFRARYGHGALVPVRDVLADSGLGYPTGYLGAPRAHPTWRTLTERDAAFLALVQRAALDDAEEISLTDADIAALSIGEPTDAVPPARVEVGVAVHAASTAALDAGDFRLQITAVPPVPTSMAGRFTHLLHDHDTDQLANTYAVASGEERVVVAQLSFPPRRPHNENVTRVPRLLPHLIPLAEHPIGAWIDLDDLAVTADGDHLYLVQISTGRPVLPHVPHALDLSVQSPPLARFLAEVTGARGAAFGPFDVGAARTLPYLPRIRYGRTVLAAARWSLTARDLPAQAGDAWDTTLQAWRRRWRVPDRVVLCDGELRLPLDLDHRLDRLLLRGRLTGAAARVELQEDAHPNQLGWIGRPAELLIPMAPITAARPAVPPLAASGELLLPGRSVMVHARLAGNPARFDEIITTCLPQLGDALAAVVERWWLRRHRDLIRLDADQHLVLMLRLTDPEQYAPVTAQLWAFAADLLARGLPAQLSFAPYQHQPGRYGDGPALAAAEKVFAADTACAIAQIEAADRAGIPGQAVAAASMVRIAAAFAPDPTSGYRALLGCLPQHTGPLDRSLRDHAVRLAHPDHAGCVNSIGAAVTSAWSRRDAALTAYRAALAGRRDLAEVLPRLLHEHHVRALGVDPTFEKITNRLARAAARQHLALADTR